MGDGFFMDPAGFLCTTDPHGSGSPRRSMAGRWGRSARGTGLAMLTLDRSMDIVWIYSLYIVYITMLYTYLWLITWNMSWNL